MVESPTLIYPLVVRGGSRRWHTVNLSLSAFTSLFYAAEERDRVSNGTSRKGHHFFVVNKGKVSVPPLYHGRLPVVGLFLLRVLFLRDAAI